ncbi:hypothetical protein [Nocardia sp. NPDC051570]|uniref:hypothetical protein n=1 Tax=Nocardia sp. NPDC051570 TaxID=3364324 RepID=UPI0037B54164
MRTRHPVTGGHTGGGAASCPSSLSGRGASMAVVGAYVVAGEPKSAGGDYITRNTEPLGEAADAIELADY